jgi:hypothetical protein
MIVHGRALGASAFGAGGVASLPMGLIALGPLGACVLSVLWALAGVVVVLGPALFAYQAANKLGPKALAVGAEVDVSCRALTIHVSASHVLGDVALDVHSEAV